MRGACKVPQRVFEAVLDVLWIFYEVPARRSLCEIKNRSGACVDQREVPVKSFLRGVGWSLYNTTCLFARGRQSSEGIHEQERVGGVTGIQLGHNFAHSVATFSN